MKMKSLIAAVMIGLAWFSGPSIADSAVEAYRTMGLKVKNVLSGTTLTARVLPRDSKQLVVITTYMTGSREKADAVNVRLDIFESEAGKLTSVFTRDYGVVNGGFVSDGNIQVIDLDRDGVSEIIVSYDSYIDPLIEQQIGEVLFREETGFRVAWTGPLEYDATKAGRGIPTERRDRFLREIDLSATIKTRGVTLFFTKTVIAVAGERLPEPKFVRETFPLQIRQAY